MAERGVGAPFRVLLVDNDEDVADIVVAILSDEGYSVEVVSDTSHESIAAAVGKQEPDCLLLDGEDGLQYGSSWAEAAYLADRERPIPTVMFTAHALDAREAHKEGSERAQAADFAAILKKPFGLDDLLEAVATACGNSEPFSQSSAGDRERTVALARRLREAGATDIRTSDRREWATFRAPESNDIGQLYWWQKAGVYIVGRYGDDARLAPVGRFFELDAALDAAMLAPA